MRLVLAIVLTCIAGGPIEEALADSQGLAIPRRSRALGPGEYVSSRTFRKTVVFFRKQLSKRGYHFKEIPVYGYRGVLVARFVAEKDGPWRAVHVYRIKGRTYIYVVPRVVDKGVDPPEESG